MRSIFNQIRACLSYPELVRLFSISKEPEKNQIYRKIREPRIEALTGYCIDNGIDYYPKELSRIPEFGPEVEEYIRKRAKEDLPESQFNDSGLLFEESDLVEIGGFLGYANAEIFEINYSPPENTTQIFIPKPYSGELISKLTMNISPTEFPKSDLIDSIISWHSHHSGFGELSEGDIKSHGGYLYDQFKDKVYEIIYLPSIDSCVWYKIKS